jgi:hypothetical protein
MATTTTEIPVTLSKDEILRYSRHLIMPEVGMEGQQKLKAARVLCIGTGGLGITAGAVSGCGWRGYAGPGGFRCGRLHQSAAADHPLDRRCGAEEAGFRGG